MPILPKALSKKLLNATEKVKNYVESWDLDEGPKPTAPPDLNSSSKTKVNESVSKYENQSSHFIPTDSQINVGNVQAANDSPSVNCISSDFDFTCLTDNVVSNKQKGNLNFDSFQKPVLDETKYLPTTLFQNSNIVCSSFSYDVLKSSTLTDVSADLNNDNNFHNASPYILVNNSHDKLNTSENFSKQSVDILNLTNTLTSCSSNSTSNSRYLNPGLNSCNTVWSFHAPITSVASTSIFQQSYFQNETNNFHVEHTKKSNILEKADNQQPPISDLNSSGFVNQYNTSNISDKIEGKSKVSDEFTNVCETLNNIHPLIVNDKSPTASIVNLNNEACTMSNLPQPNHATELDVNNFQPVNVSRNFKSHSRLWCIFCKNNNHFSHSCLKFRSKEQYWGQILAERRCKNCFRFYHKAADCFNQSFCKNISCHRRDKHSPVLCDSNYFHSDYYLSKTQQCYNFFSQVPSKKPPPLMSLDLSHIHNSLIKRKYRSIGKPVKRKTSVSVSISKTTNDVSTQTSEDLIVPENSVSYQSQYCQTDDLKANVSFAHQCSYPITVLDSKQKAIFSHPP